MKTVTIKDITYDMYAAYADGLDANLSFAVSHDYNPRLKQGKFLFQDSSYIPACMRKFAMGITGNDARVLKANLDIMSELNKLKETEPEVKRLLNSGA
jgi:hypothetical protein